MSDGQAWADEMIETKGRKLRNLSLFTGSGIGDYAAKQCGIEIVAQCEIDPACIFCLERLWPKTLKFKDVHDVSVESLGSVLPIDIISGGFPCQDLSTAGHGQGIEGGRSGLWREMFRVIRQVRPTWLLIENVPAIRLRGVDRVIAPLERIGYTCWPLVVGAWSVGAPHKRDRVWLVAHRNQSGCKRSLADCGESYAGTDGRHNARRGGSVANAEQDGRRQGSREQGNEISERSGRCESSGGLQLADSNKARRKKCLRIGRDNGEKQPSVIGSCWPSRPGEPQHEWEVPRLTQFGMGNAVDGLARRVRSRANKDALRMVGNGWAWGVPSIIYQWIVNVENNT
jgi:DNA (cytosine-5)-methyltransferase 1